MNLFTALLFVVTVLSTILNGLCLSQIALIPTADPVPPSSTTPPSTSDRVVTNLQQIFGSHGVPISYHYNETVSFPTNQFISVPGCPKAIDGYPWIHYGNPPRCYLAGQTGPCSIGQRLYIMLGSTEGACSCECLAAWSRQSQGYSKHRFLSCPFDLLEDASFGQIIDIKHKKCYSVFDKGPCRKGSVVINHVGTSLICGQLCDTSAKNWREKRKQKPCVAVDDITPPLENVSESRYCLDGEIFSETLQTCLRSSPEYLLIEYPDY